MTAVTRSDGAVGMDCAGIRVDLMFFCALSQIENEEQPGCNDSHNPEQSAHVCFPSGPVESE